MTLTRDVFDYVIVGAGTAGALLANRLSEDGATVCLLEAGPRDSHPMIHIPAGFVHAAYNPRLTWGFSSEPGPGTANRRVLLPQGRVLGGSSSINGLNYNRGQRADYDGWAQMGNPGWSYAEVLPYFRRTERRVGAGDERYRGRTGELPITDLDWRHPICEAFIAGAEGLGIPRNSDYNGKTQLGSGYFQRTIENGYRISSARAFLRPARGRRNLDIRTNTQASALLFDGRRAIAVRFVTGGRGGASAEIAARREIVLCAGTVNTAKLLQLSGIGDAGQLAALGIPVVHDLPGVGDNLCDHYAVRMVSRLKNVRTINSMAQGAPLLLEIARWLVGRPSLLAVSPSLVHVFWKSLSSLDNPDLQFVFTPASFRDGVVGLLDKVPGMTCGVWQERPESMGHVRLRSADAFDAPLIQPNYLAAEHDRQVLIAGMKLGRRLMRTPLLAPYFEKETVPGDGVVSDDEFLGFARQNGGTAYHLIGTARMGPAARHSSVVDAQLRVHGIEALRIADASIMPAMPSANTNAATLMIAEKAADLIRRRPALPSAEL